MTPKHMRVAVPVSFAGLGAVYYGISMLSLANGNMTTALAVASNVEFLPAIAAMSLRAAPSLVLPLVLYGIYRIAKYQKDDVEGQIIIFLAVLAALVAVFYSSVLVLGLCLLLLVLHLVHLRSYKKNWKRKFDRGRFDPELARMLMVSIIMTSVIWGPSWLVRETTSIGDKKHVVSVVKETDEMLFYLDRKTDRVMYAKPSDLSERLFCSNGDVTTVNALFLLLTKGPTYPDCPSTRDL